MTSRLYKRSNRPICFSGIVSSLSSMSRRRLAVDSSEQAIAKSSTCRRKITCRPLMIPKYKQGSCVVGNNSILRKMQSACFSHNHGDSGWPCIAKRTRITAPGGIGSRFLRWTHQSQNALSGKGRSPALGVGLLQMHLRCPHQRWWGFPPMWPHRISLHWFKPHSWHRYNQGFKLALIGESSYTCIAPSFSRIQRTSIHTIFFIYPVISLFFTCKKSKFSCPGLQMNSHTKLTYSFPQLKIILISTWIKAFISHLSLLPAQAPPFQRYYYYVT